MCIRDRAKDVQEWALEQARDHGVAFPGYKLVEGRSNRKVVQPGAAMDALAAEGYAAADYQKPAELVPIGKLDVYKRQLDDTFLVGHCELQSL